MTGNGALRQLTSENVTLYIAFTFLNSTKSTRASLSILKLGGAPTGTFGKHYSIISDENCIKLLARYKIGDYGT